jgi:hypothetical protein
MNEYSSCCFWVEGNFKRRAMKDELEKNLHKDKDTQSQLEKNKK